MNKWALTMRYTNLKKQIPTRELYRQRLSDLSRLGCQVYNVNYETTNGLHLHGVIKTPITFNMKRLRCRGWKTVLKVMFDEEEWGMYMTKDQPDDTDDDCGVCSEVIEKLAHPLWGPSPTDWKKFAEYKMSINENTDLSLTVPSNYAVSSAHLRASARTKTRPSAGTPSA